MKRRGPGKRQQSNGCEEASAGAVLRLSLFIIPVCNPIKAFHSWIHGSRGILNPSASEKCAAPGLLKGYKVNLLCPYKWAEATSFSLKVDRLEKGMGASTAHISCAALQWCPLTPTKLTKKHSCLLLCPSVLTPGCGPHTTFLLVLCSSRGWAPKWLPDAVPRCWVKQRLEVAPGEENPN